LTSPTEPSAEEWEKLRPRDRMFLYAVDRLASLEARAKLECREPACGVKDEEGVLACVNSRVCGEKLMLSGWRRELHVMRELKGLVEWLEQRDLEKAAEKLKRNRR